MRSAIVYLNGKRVGELTEVNGSLYTFRYDDLWFVDDDLPAISLTLSKKQQAYQADHLFPFFANMLSEGVNRQLQSRHLQIDEIDDFGLLLKTAQTDTIGAVTVHPIETT
ncbi:MAG: HipA N-terminal domain-containing protein [Bacteroidota bacterium]